MRPGPSQTERCKLGATQRVEQSCDEFRLLAREHNVAPVAGLIRSVERRPASRALVAGDRIAIFREHGPKNVKKRADGDVVHADIDVIAFTSLRSPKQRHEDTSQPLQAGENVRDRNTWNGRLTVRPQRHAEKSALGFERKVVRGPIFRPDGGEGSEFSSVIASSLVETPARIDCCFVPIIHCDALPGGRHICASAQCSYVMSLSRRSKPTASSASSKRRKFSSVGFVVRRRRNFSLPIATYLHSQRLRVH